MCTSNTIGVDDDLSTIQANVTLRTVSLVFSHSKNLMPSLVAKVAIGSCDLVLWLPQSQREGNGTRSAVKLDLEDIGDVISRQFASLRAIGFHKE